LSCEARLLSGNTVLDTGTLLVAFESILDGTAGVVSGLNVVIDGNGVTHGFLTIADLQTAANAALSFDTNCVSGHSWRANPEMVKAALDQLNNSLIQVVA
jgi:hypothetical protein